jgi:hypothetical protein
LLKIAAFLELEDKDAKIEKTRADTRKADTAAMKDVSDIATAEKGNFLSRAKLVLDALKAESAAAQKQDQMELAGGQGRVPGMEEQPGNAMGAPAAASPGGAGGIVTEGAALPLNGIAGPGMGDAPSPGGP